MAVQNTQRKQKQGSTEVTDVMIARNLQQCGKWTAEEEYRPRKMIASIIYKYVREAMFKGKAVTQLVVDEFGLPKMTIHRQIYGKKYPAVIHFRGHYCMCIGNLNHYLSIRPLHTI